MTHDPRPANCRSRLRGEGKAYPKSGCSACDASIRTGLVCPYVESEPQSKPASVCPDYTLEQLQNADDAATSGIWGQFNGRYGPHKAVYQSMSSEMQRKHHDTSHHTSIVRPDGTPYRVAEFRHADDAAFAEMVVNMWRTGQLLYVG